MENPAGRASELAPYCFLQGSYKQDTAIYTINDVDIVCLCNLWFPGSGGSGGGRSWSRDEIFDTVAAPLRADARYRDKLRYNTGSMCIKVQIQIDVEILPVVYKAGTYDRSAEPFALYRPERDQWEDGYARYHQHYLSRKNEPGRTASNFVPAIKVFKHLRSRFGLDAVSFHVECLLYNLRDGLFSGGPADYIPSLLSAIAAHGPEAWYRSEVRTPCQERDIFTSEEWGYASWRKFHEAVVVWNKAAILASAATQEGDAIAAWQTLFGQDFFPETVA